MNTYFFRPDFYASRYNCTAYSMEEWSKFGPKQPALGITFFIVGAFCTALYIPFLVGMMAIKKFRDMSCYKIMFTLGLYDLGNIGLGAFGTGYLTMVGAVFCSHPNLIYFNGLFGVCCWCSSCMACVLLGFNRIIDFTRADLSDMLFAGNKTWVWMLLPAGYFIWIALFEMPVIFDPTFVTWYYNPFKTGPVHYNYKYTNATHSINNVAVIFILVAENIFLTYIIFKHAGSMSSTQRRKRQVILQMLIISFLVVLAASVYVYMNYFYIPPLLTTIGTLAYQLNSGSPAIVYLVMNKSLRGELLSFFREHCPHFVSKKTATVAAATTNKSVSISGQGGRLTHRASKTSLDSAPVL